MTLYFVQLCEHRGQPWGLPRVVRADSPEEAARQAFPIPPSSLHVKHAWVAALAEPYLPTQVEIDVPKPKWGKARPANPQAREPQRKVEVVKPGDPRPVQRVVETAGSEYVLPEDVEVSFTVEDVDRSLYDDREFDARAERARERAL